MTRRELIDQIAAAIQQLDDHLEDPRQRSNEIHKLFDNYKQIAARNGFEGQCYYYIWDAACRQYDITLGVYRGGNFQG